MLFATILCNLTCIDQYDRSTQGCPFEMACGYEGCAIYNSNKETDCQSQCDQLCTHLTDNKLYQVDLKNGTFLAFYNPFYCPTGHEGFSCKHNATNGWMSCPFDMSCSNHSGCGIESTLDTCSDNCAIDCLQKDDNVAYQTKENGEI